MEQHKFQGVRFDEKVTVIPNAIEQHEPSKARQRRQRLIKGMAIATVVFLWWSLPILPKFPSSFGRQREVKCEHQEKLVDFDDIVPSEKLEWHPCFTYSPAIKCARLTVPMDYNRPLNESEDNPRVHVALLLVPGKHDGQKKFSTSPLLLNPGGPGGAGTMLALGFSDRLHKIVGEEQDIIGFDPRGIGATTPRTDCFAYSQDGSAANSSPGTGGGEDYVGGNFHRFLWMTAGKQVGIVNSTSSSLDILATRSKSLARLCQEKDSSGGKDSIFKYVHTPSVARDMLSIMDAWDEWTDSLNVGPENSPQASEEPKDLQPELAPSLDTKGKLVYWGFSYGTLLGATFASMFPDRVGRVVLDGVVDGDHYVAPVWMDSIRDADAIFNSFPKYCHDAKEECDLYRPGDKISDVKERLFGTLNNLRDNPITVIDSYSNTPVIITYGDIKSIIFSILYSPTFGFELLATFLNIIHQGNAELIAMIFALPFLFDLTPLCATPLPAWQYPNEAQSAIMCSDKRYPLNETVPNLELVLDQMSNISSFADVWLTVMLGCEGWGIEAIDPPMRWDDHPAHKQKPINTSYPVLFVSNTEDPVTPLYAGVRMAKKFVNAGLIEQKSMGHCSLAAVSKCTIEKIRAYFTEGKVPPPPIEGEKGRELVDGKWDRCEADEWPFHPYDGNTFIAQGGEVEIAERMTALKEMQETFREMKHWGQHGLPAYTLARGL